MALGSCQCFFSFLISIFCLLPVAVGQSTTFTPYQPLPTTPCCSDNSGIFTWPNTSTGTQIFLDGTVMNVQWQASFSNVNLYAIPDHNAGLSQQLTTNTNDKGFAWTVTCHFPSYSNCSVVWHLRAVNAQGTFEEQHQFGFFTADFWIQDSNPSATLTRSTTSSSSTFEASSSKDTSSTEMHNYSSTIAISSSTAISQTSITSTSRVPSPAIQTPATKEKHHGPSVLTTSVAVGVGAGIAAIAVFAIVYIIWKRKRRGKEISAKLTRVTSQRPSVEEDKRRERPEKSSKVPAFVSSELPAYNGRGWHEVPDFQEPQELPVERG